MSGHRKFKALIAPILADPTRRAMMEDASDRLKQRRARKKAVDQENIAILEVLADYQEGVISGVISSLLADEEPSAKDVMRINRRLAALQRDGLVACQLDQDEGFRYHLTVAGLEAREASRRELTDEEVARVWKESESLIGV